MGLLVVLLGIFLLTSATTLVVLGRLQTSVLGSLPDAWKRSVEPNLIAVIMAGVVLLGLGWFIHRQETAPPRYLRPPERPEMSTSASTFRDVTDR